MLGLPSSTEVNRRITKEKLYANASMTPQVRAMIKDQIEAVVWRNKLADSTIGVAEGVTVKEIQVFEVQLRQYELDKRVLAAIAKAIPYKILFVLMFDNKAQAWMEAADTFYNTSWSPLDDFTLKIEGLNLDVVYANLVRQIAGCRLGTEGDINESVEHDKQRQRLLREIAVLEKKVQREKQFNRQVELNGELKRLRAELEEI
ncbi:MAG TPA: DUF4391 domain-containing protein [Firmicutes bacterium]|nr:DUF4391 domain-containing protein [Bacillota bacterium]